MRDACAGLLALHAGGIVHATKPANVLVTGAGAGNSRIWASPSV